MVDVEERALGALEEDVVASPERVLDEPGRIGQVRLQAAAPRQGLLHERLDLERRRLTGRAQQQVLVGQHQPQLVTEHRLVEEILHAQAQAGRSIGIRRADAPAGRPDRLVGEARLGPAVQGRVVRHDHVRAVAHPHVGDVDAPRHEGVELPDQRCRIDDHAGTDDARDVRVQHAGRDEVELEDLVAEHDRVAGIVPALVAHGHGHLLGQEVGRLALALVAPLQAHDHGGRHQGGAPTGRSPRRGPTKKAPAVRPGTWIDCPLAAPEIRR